MEPSFIVIEGIDGCGKDTQIERLQTYLEDKGRRTIKVTDPGTTDAGNILRAVLLDKTVEMGPEEQLLLYTAARVSLRNHIAANLRAGTDVICSRWVMSTLVYQGMVQKVGSNLVQDMHDTFVKLNPAAYILLDLPAEVAQRRVHDRNTKAADQDRFESKGVEFADNLRRCYKVTAENNPHAWIVDADQDEEYVFAGVLEACELKIKGFPR